MEELAGKRCKPCEGGVEPLSRETAESLLSSLQEGWQLTDDGLAIEREFRFPAYARTIAFANAVAFIATNEGHHPVLTVGYGFLRVLYTTTAINGLSDNDFICAAKIDRLASEL